MTTITDRPILFSAPMVRAILDGSKTQTRRVVKPRKDLGIGCELAPCELAGEVNAGDYSNSRYRPGDRLWVREAWQHLQNQNGELAATLNPKSCRECFYRADESDPRSLPMSGKWRPSIHMPRWASRITLEITGVRVERLQDISESDAIAEGIERVTVKTGATVYPFGNQYSHDSVAAYSHLWEAINGTGSWAANPWVWVVEFKRVTP